MKECILILGWFLLFLPAMAAGTPPKSGDEIRYEAHLEKDINPIFESAWAENKYGFLNYWDNDLESKVTKALASGVDINARDSHGRTALMHAVTAPNTGLFSFLIKMGAQIDLKDNYGQNAEEIRLATKNNIAAFSGLEEVIKNVYQGMSISPILFEAIVSGDKKILELWFNKGISPDFTSGKFGFSLFDQAAELQKYDMMDFLIEHGAKLSQKALERALGAGRIQVVNYLMEKGIPLNFVEEVQLQDGSTVKILKAFFEAAIRYYYYAQPEYLEFLEKIKLESVDTVILSNTKKYLLEYHIQFPSTEAERNRREAAAEILQQKIQFTCQAIFSSN